MKRIIPILFVAIAASMTSCKAWRTISTTATYTQATDSTKTTTTITSKTVEEYQGVKKRWHQVQSNKVRCTKERRRRRSAMVVSFYVRIKSGRNEQRKRRGTDVSRRGRRKYQLDLYIWCEKFPQEVISSVNYSGFGWESWTKMDYLGQKRYFFAFFQNQSKVIGHSFCNFAADLADGARFCLAWCAQSAEPLNQIGMHQSMKLQKKSGRLEEK